ncbi:sensor histidine kinase [Actinomycetospora sp. CA-084318]|uniref:sensor histidine kinase n=1 Tax=Actinomycetospora sp. CA-084318 TaxID=3239892 RepID=UPI003D99A98D
MDNEHDRRPVERSRPSVPLLCVIAGVVVFAAVAVLPAWRTDPLLALVNLAVTIGFAVTALVLTGEPDQRPNVHTFLVAAACWTAGYTSVLAPTGPWALVQWVVGPLVFPVLMAVLLRYPFPRPLAARDRVLVVTLAVLLAALRITWALIEEPGRLGFDPRSWWPTLRTSPTIAAACDIAFAVVGALGAIVFSALATRRLLRAHGIDRRLLRPVASAAVASAVVVGAETISRLATLPRWAADLVIAIEALALLAIPVAFAVSAVRRRLAHAAMADLVMALARPVTPEFVQRALAVSLGDPTLRVIYHHPAGEGHIESGGRAASAPPAPHRCTRTVDAGDGTLLATLEMDASLSGHPDLVYAAVSAARLAIENSWLQATTEASLEEVRNSRARLVGAGDDARRRIERDLHDGVQQRLLALKVSLATARPRATGPGERTMIDLVRVEIQETLDELRALSRGLLPGVLTESGLRPAICSVAERMPLEVETRIPEERLDPLVEATAYFVCCEALANAVKHSGATTAQVVVDRHGETLRVSVRDHGRGGAQEKVGGGIAGLRDRVSAVGGRLTVSSDDEGTKVEVTIPCA